MEPIANALGWRHRNCAMSIAQPAVHASCAGDRSVNVELQVRQLAAFVEQHEARGVEHFGLLDRFVFTP